jgi:signal transduction histidine kinase
MFSEARGSVAGTLEALTATRRALLTTWKRELRKIGLSDNDADLWKLTGRVSRMSFRTFQRELTGLGRELARNQTPLQQVVSVATRLMESILRHLRADPQRALDILKLGWVAQEVIIAAYAEYEGARIHGVEAKLSDAEKRLLGASAYVTNVYEQERRGLSHDLHDDIGHDLVMLKLHLELSSSDLEEQKLPSLRQRLDAARILVSHTIESIRRMVLDLGPTVFDDLGFVPAIRYYVRRFSTSTGIQVVVEEGDLPPDIPASHQIALYRILQGALSNVVKHARAKHVRVALACLKSSVLVLTIEDDGVGFEISAAKSGRFGLTAMRERVSVLGGKVHVQTWPTAALGKRHGTRIEVDLPLPRSD